MLTHIPYIPPNERESVVISIQSILLILSDLCALCELCG
jgi:hypothetical protein